MGIVLAVTFLAGIPSFTRLVTGGDSFAFFPALGTWLSLIGYAAVAFVLIAVPLRARDT
jgi:hypothetical protein